MNRQSIKRSFSADGFTLIEVIVAMVILGIGLLAIAQMQVVAIQTNTVNRDVTEATTLALDKLEYLKALPLDDKQLTDRVLANNSDLAGTETVDHPDPDNAPVETSDPIDGKYTLVWNVADNEDTKSITVVVTWLSGHKQEAKRVTLPTVLLDK